MAAQEDLNARQLRFVLGVIEGKDAKSAYINAGYKARGNAAEASASKLLRNPKVATFIDRMRGELQEETKVSAKRVIDELAKLAFSSMGDYVDFGADGVTLRDSSDLTADQLAAVQMVGETPGQFGTSIKFRLYDKRAALVDLGKHLGIFGRPDDSDDSEIDAIARALEETPDDGEASE